MLLLFPSDNLAPVNDAVATKSFDASQERAGPQTTPKYKKEPRYKATQDRSLKNAPLLSSKCEYSKS